MVHAEHPTKRARIPPKRLIEIPSSPGKSKATLPAKPPTVASRAKTSKTRSAGKKRDSAATTESNLANVPTSNSSEASSGANLDKLFALIERMDARIGNLERTTVVPPPVLPQQQLISCEAQMPQPPRPGPLTKAGAQQLPLQLSQSHSVEGDSPVTRAMQAYISYQTMKKLFR